MVSECVSVCDSWRGEPGGKEVCEYAGVSFPLAGEPSVTLLPLCAFAPLCPGMRHAVALLQAK